MIFSSRILYEFPVSLFPCLIFCYRVQGRGEEKEERKRKNGEIRIPNGLFTRLCVLSVFYYVKRLAYLVLVSDYGPPPHISSYFIFFRFRGKIIVGELGVIGRRCWRKPVMHADSICRVTLMLSPKGVSLFRVAHGPTYSQEIW